MSTQLIDPTTYPISTATARELERALFGHVIDGDVVASLDGGTMPVGRAGQRSRRSPGRPRAGPRCRAGGASARAAFDDGRWRLPAPLEKERRLRRLAELLAERGDVFSDIDVLDAGLLRLHGLHRASRLDGVDYYAGWPSKIAGTIPAVPTDVAVYVVREPIGVIGLDRAVERTDVRARLRRGRARGGNSVVVKPAEQTPMAAVLMGQLASRPGSRPASFNVLQGG